MDHEKLGKIAFRWLIPAVLAGIFAYYFLDFIGTPATKEEWAVITTISYLIVVFLEYFGGVKKIDK